MKISAKGLTVKLVLLVIAPALIGVVGSVYFNALQEKRIYDQYFTQKAESIAKVLDSSVNVDLLKDKEKLLSQLLKLKYLDPSVLELTVYTPQKEGLIIWVSSDLSHPEEFANSEMFTVLEEDGLVSRAVDFEGNSAYQVIVPIHYSGQVVGIYDIYLSTVDFYAQAKADTIRTVIITGAILIGVITFLFFVIRRLVVFPLNKLIVGAETIGQGDLSHRVQISSKDEIGHLADIFNSTSQKLQDSYANLENKVEERTKELAQKVKYIADQNLTLQEGKTAMLNILEDQKKLEEELKVEKAGVEAKVQERTKELVAAKDQISQGWLQIKEEKAKLSSSIENLPVGFIMISIEGELIVINNYATTLLNKVPWERITEELKKILGDRLDFDDYVKHCGEGKQRLIFDNVTLNNRITKILMSPILTGDRKEECVGVVILLEDVTEAKILERSRDEFFSIASHELRTPLTAIRGNTDLILEYYADKLTDPDLKEMVGDIHESSVRLIDIVNDFLNVSRLEQGRLEFKPVVFDIVDLADKAIREYQVTGSRRKLYINIEKPQAILPQVYADPDKTRQVLINLVGNGIKFTEEGGITINFEMENEYRVKVLVTDTGRGISKQNQNLLFHKFQQAGSSLYTRDTTKGTGLGLYISKLLIEGMGGTISLVKSEDAKGSTFAFTLPVNTSRVAQPKNIPVVSETS
jgi:signal transduction histidine kinase/methyl-accepting chemotaxis protein